MLRAYSLLQLLALAALLGIFSTGCHLGSSTQFTFMPWMSPNSEFVLKSGCQIESPSGNLITLTSGSHWTVIGVNRSKSGEEVFRPGAHNARYESSPDDAWLIVVAGKDTETLTGVYYPVAHRYRSLPKPILLEVEAISLTGEFTM